MLGSIKAALAAAATTIKSALPTVVAATTATVLTGGCIYYYTIKDGIYEKRDDNVRYVLEEYISQISIDSVVSDGNGGYAYSTDLDKTVEEIVDKLKESGSNITEYTGKNNEEEILSKFIKAEIITQFPDLRSEESIRKDKEIGKNELQGGIKIIRKDSNKDTSQDSTDITYKINENDKILTYIPYSIFNEKKDSGDQDIKNHFSIKSSGENTTSIDIVVAGWTEEKTTVTTVENIPSDDGTKDEKKTSKKEENPKYSFHEISINYQNSLSKYSMPAGFLWSLLVMGESTSFVEKLANLAINNTEIVIEAQDNVTTTENTNVQKYTYKKDVTKTVVAEDGTTKKENTVLTAKEESSITTTITTTQSNTSLNLVYAETWVATYKKNYKNTVKNEEIEETDWLKDAEWSNSEDVEIGTDKKVSDNANNDTEYTELKNKIIEEITNEKCEQLLTSKIGILENTNVLYYVFNWDVENGKNVYNKSIEYMYNYIKSGFIEEFFNNIAIKSKMNEYISNFWNNKSKEVEKIYSDNGIKKDDILNELYKMLKDVSNSMITLDSAQTETINQKVENKSTNNVQTANTNVYTTAGTNVQERVDIDKDNNFIVYFNESGRAKEYILDSPDWVYEMLESHEKTANMVDLFKYLLYQATGNNYGITTFDFSLIDISNYNSVSGINLLKEYIHYFENGSGAPVNGDGTKYIIHDDGKGHPTVGYGIDIFNGGYAPLFEQAGYPTSIGGEVDIEFVDALEEQEIDRCLTEVRARTSGLNLTEYQIHALVSRAYNCGVEGALGLRNNKTFVQAYEEYWNSEEDNYFEEKNSNANFSHNLYTQYMCKPTTSGGEELAGLVKRRKSEWILFQTGYYNVIDKWYVNGGAIVEVADRIHKYMEQNQYTYCVYGSNDYEECKKFGKTCKLSSNFEDSKQNKNTCCATYVSWVLQEAGYITESEHTNGAASLINRLLNKGWSKISNPSELKAGDIIFYSYGHIEIYAGDGNVYNAGSGSAIRGASPHSININSISFGVRAPG